MKFSPLITSLLGLLLLAIRTQLVASIYTKLEDNTVLIRVGQINAPFVVPGHIHYFYHEVLLDWVGDKKGEWGSRFGRNFNRMGFADFRETIDVQTARLAHGRFSVRCYFYNDDVVLVDYPILAGEHLFGALPGVTGILCRAYED